MRQAVYYDNPARRLAHSIQNFLHTDTGKLQTLGNSIWISSLRKYSYHWLATSLEQSSPDT